MKFQTPKFLFALVLTVVLMGVVYLRYCTQQKPTPTNDEAVLRAQAQLHDEELAAIIQEENITVFKVNPFPRIGRAIQEAYNTHKFNLEDFEKLDFSKPGEAGYGDDPNFEIFNPSGPFKIPPNESVIILNSELNASLQTELQVFYTIYRRKTSDGTVWDSIYAVIPNISLSVCDRSPEKISINHAVKLTSLLEGAVSVDPSLQNLSSLACIYNSQLNLYYLFNVVISRFKTSGATKWQH